MSGANAITKKLGVAAAMGAAMTTGCGSDSNPEPPAQADSGAGGGQADALSELFETGSPEDVAQQIEAMVEASDDGSGGAAGSAPLYEGITFS